MCHQLSNERIAAVDCSLTIFDSHAHSINMSYPPSSPPAFLQSLPFQLNHRNAPFKTAMPRYHQCAPSRRNVQSLPTSPNMLFFRKREETIIDLDHLGRQHPAIRVSNLRKVYQRRLKKKSPERALGIHAKQIVAVEDVSFTMEQGCILGLLGPNSSGKTTVLQCISTLVKPDSGSVEFYGMDVAKNSRMARMMMGCVLQSAGVDKVLTGREHLDLFADLAHLWGNEKQNVIAAVIALLNLDEFIDRETGVYSGGVLRRLDLAIALLHRPPILVLDEPTAGLDVESRHIIWDVLRSWRKDGGTAIFSSHYLEEVESLADQVCILEKGILIAKGSPGELKHQLGGDRITVRLEEFTSFHNAETVCSALRATHLVKTGIVNRFQNNAIELVVDSDSPTVGGEIVQRLRDLGYLSLFSFSQSKPSLNDVYLAATGSSLMDADLNAKTTRTEKVMRKESMK